MDHQCLLEKLLWMKPLSGIHQMSAIQLLKLMRASSIPIQCVKTCQQDCTQDGKLIPICKNSKLDTTDLAILRTWSCLTTKKPDQNAELRASTHLEIKRKLTVSMLMDIAITAKQCLKQWDAITIFGSCQDTRPSLSDEDIERGNKRRDMDDLRREYIREKGYKIEEMWECEWWQSFKTNEKIKNYILSNFPYKRPLSTDSLLEKIRDGSLYGYIQCDLVVPDELKAKFSNFPPIFKNTEIGSNDIGEYMKKYAIENDLLKHPQRMLISGFKQENCSIITPLFNFYMELGLQCTKVYRFVRYLPRKCFNKFVQSVVDARREGDENPLSGVVAETMKLLGNSSYGYQIMDRSRHTITKYLNDEKTHKAINEPLFKRLNTVQKDLYEIELLKSTIEHKEPIIVGFFILQYAKLRMLEFTTIFFDKFCDVNKFEELEMDTDSLYLALAEENLYDCIRSEKKGALEILREKNCRDHKL